MGKQSWLGVVLAVLVASWAVPQEARTDQEKLQGTWRVAAIEEQGQKLPAEKVAKLELTLTIQGDKYNEKVKGETVEEGTIKMQADKNPRQMDILIATGKDKGKTQLAIYKLEGDTLTVAIAPADSKERPTRFTTEAGSSFGVQVFRREKK
jgi:uncharacterized protein (TIGR03067 family)